MGFSGRAAADPEPQVEGRIVAPGAVPTPARWGTDIAGFFVHIGPRVDPAAAQVSDQCAFADWRPSETRQCDVVLINRLDESSASVRLPLYVPDRIDVNAGDLFIVNRVHPCESGYTGIELEQIGADPSLPSQ